MGQYHYTVNLDKKEFIHPHKLGDGLKLLEQCGWSPGGTNDALHLLLACSSGRGGGDFQSDPYNPAFGTGFVGRWAGDRIAVVGDYAVNEDLAPEHQAGGIYGRCGEQDPEDEPLDDLYRDITDELIPTLEREYEILYVGDGWKRRIDLSSSIEGYGYSHGWGDRVAVIEREQFPMSQVREAVRAAWIASEEVLNAGEKKKLTLADLKATGLLEAQDK